ncbi:hypothetical protein EYC80_005924 [Monilinia laxa]|uniref:Uncharacterized protein n=1 Tax=Monilinia laxa TaxID=61186 RepID=A0A5N6KFT9_MONLA|nr:hypothetical protein EYC80_005924 [Monilinia laxa]
MHQAIDMKTKILNYCTLPEKPLKMYMIETLIISTETPSFLYTSPSPLFHPTPSKNKTNTTIIMSFPTYYSRRSPFPKSTSHSSHSNKYNLKPAAMKIRQSHLEISNILD